MSWYLRRPAGRLPADHAHWDDREHPVYQDTITGVPNLVEEREQDFTVELFGAPISRYAVLLGKTVASAGRR